MMEKLYLEIKQIPDDVQNIINFYTTLETFITLFTYKYINLPNNIEIYLVRSSKVDDNESNDKFNILLNFPNIKYKLLTYTEYENQLASYCRLPVLVTSDNIIVAGLCSVCRTIIKIGGSTEFESLLGFKGGCLLAPTETSVWTKFCEIDIINCTNILLNTEDLVTQNVYFLPKELQQFEKHMSHPIRKHNIYKLARDIANNKYKNEINSQDSEETMYDEQINMEKLSLNNKVSVTPEKLSRNEKSHKSKKMRKNPIQIPSNVPVSDLKLEHIYAEGQEMTLADIILYPCFKIIFNNLFSKIDTNNLLCSPLEILSLTLKWMEQMELINEHKLVNCFNCFTVKQYKNIKLNNTIKEIKFSKNNEILSSLYKCDPRRYKAKNRIFTKQPDIDESLLKINKMNLNITSKLDTSSSSALTFDWNNLPFDALPEGGNLPEKRLLRKRQQLENLIIPILSMARENDRIIDFCSGTGHLGIILAYKLPNCKIFLLENRAESVNRAKKRIELLQLKNIYIIQSNLDYFTGHFNIGTSLHACGIATDIVLSICIRERVNFVCCPCCYGAIHNMYHIYYPRSLIYRKFDITYSNYIFIAHCADQAHAIADDQTLTKNCNNIEKCKQGAYCMDIIDMDRKLYAEEFGYTVQITRLIPENCTPKNRLLIGII